MRHKPAAIRDFKLASTKNVVKMLVIPEGIPFRINRQVNQMDIAAGQGVVQPLEDLCIVMQPGIDKGKGVWRYVLLLRTLLQARKRGERWAWWALLVGNTVALVSAMTYDKTVNAIGPFETLEYLGLVMVWAALAITAPFRAAAQRIPATG